ncbi:MAG: 50S ribosomal protein L23 [Patescibacteria group bacterium]
MFKVFNQKSDTKAKHAPKDGGAVAVKESKADKKAVPAEVVRLGAHKASGILLQPLVSEKTAHMGSQDTYAFVVGFKVNKVEIAKAFQAMFGVKPMAIRIAIVPEKRKRRGRTFGVRSSWKKAFIRVPKGSKVDIFTGV